MGLSTEHRALSTGLKVHAALSVVAILFSSNYIISKLAMHSFSPMAFAWLRVAGSALILNAITPRQGAKMTRADWREIILLTLLGVVFNQTLFLSGLALTNAHVASILITTIPVFALAAAILTGSEKATVAKIGGIGLAAIGALLIVGGEGIERSPRSAVGALLLIANCLCYAMYLVLSKPAMARLQPRVVVARMFVLGSVLMLPLAAVPLARTQWSDIPARAWIGLTLVIAGPTVLAYLLSGWALAHTDSSLVASYTYVQPVLTSVLAAVFLGEEIRRIAILAAVLIFTGVYLAGRPAPPAAREDVVPGAPD